MKNTTAIILVLIAGGLFYTFTSPRYEKVKALRAEATQYSDVLSNVTSLGEKRDELMLKYRNIPKTEIDNLKKVLPDNVNTVELAVNLDSIASKYGISIKSIRTVTEKVDGTANVIQTPSATGYEKVLVSFSFVSSYDNFRKFMTDLEQSLRIMEVRSVSFTSSEDGLSEYQLQIETYWLK